MARRLVYKSWLPLDVCLSPEMGYFSMEPTADRGNVRVASPYPIDPDNLPDTQPYWFGRFSDPNDRNLFVPHELEKHRNAVGYESEYNYPGQLFCGSLCSRCYFSVVLDKSNDPITEFPSDPVEYRDFCAVHAVKRAIFGQIYFQFLDDKFRVRPEWVPPSRYLFRSNE